MSDFQKLNVAALSAGLPVSWYPDAKRHGQSLRVGNLEGEKGASLWICLRTGAWKDHATGDGGGDLISLYAAREKISQVQAKNRLEGVLGGYEKSNTIKRGGAEVAKPSQISRNMKLAQAIWREAVSAQNTSVQAYLRGRGISYVPHTLRYHSGVLHAPNKTKCPAMIAAITRWPEKIPHAIHRTYLKGDQKASVSPNRMMLGKISGGAVRLGLVHEVMAVAEGIETALSFQQATGIPTWAVLSSSNYKGLVKPGAVKEITIAADHDENGLSKAHEAASLWVSQGVQVRVIHPPMKGQDYNDLIRGCSL